MKYRSGHAARVALSSVALAALVAATGNAWALGLGRLNVQSALGETLRAEIDISSLTPDEESSLKVRVASPDAYRTQGIDYNAVLTVDAGHDRSALRRQAVSARDQRSRGAGTLRRRDPRAHVVLGSPGARIHVAARSAAIASGATGAGGRARRTAGLGGTASPIDLSRGTDPAAGGGARHASDAVITWHRAIEQGPGGGAAHGSRRIQSPRGRHVVSHRQAKPARGCVARPDAGGAVPRQPQRVHGREHEPAEGRCRAVGAVVGRCQGGDHRRRTRGDPRAERRFRRLPPAPGRQRADRQGRRQHAPSQGQGHGVGRRLPNRLPRRRPTS